MAAAEEYYRAMFRAEVSSWNLRDLHMAETLDALVEHQIESGRSPKVIVWEHNSHVGDARSTSMSQRGQPPPPAPAAGHPRHLPSRDRDGEELWAIGSPTAGGHAWVLGGAVGLAVDTGMAVKLSSAGEIIARANHFSTAVPSREHEDLDDGEVGVGSAHDFAQGRLKIGSHKRLRSGQAGTDSLRRQGDVRCEERR